MKALLIAFALCLNAAWADDAAAPPAASSAALAPAAIATTAPNTKQTDPATAPSDAQATSPDTDQDNATAEVPESLSAPTASEDTTSHTENTPAETKPEAVAPAAAGSTAPSTPIANAEPAQTPPAPATASKTIGDTHVYVSLAPPEIPYHKQSKFTITVEAPTNADVKMPIMVNHFGGLEVYGQPDHTTEAIDKEHKRITDTYTLDPIIAGNYPIDPVTVSVNGESTTVASPAVRVRDLTKVEEEAAMRFVSGANPIDVPPPLWRQWPFWAAIAVFAALIGLAIWAYLRHRARPERVAPTMLPWEAAYARLRNLDDQKWPQAGRFPAFYVELSSILRHYIEDRFTLHAPEQTTQEFLAEASKTGVFTDEQQRVLATFLRHCDRVKFAKYTPILDEAERSFADVLRFVDETVPRPVAPEEKAA